MGFGQLPGGNLSKSNTKSSDTERMMIDTYQALRLFFLIMYKYIMFGTSHMPSYVIFTLIWGNGLGRLSNLCKVSQLSGRVKIHSSVFQFWNIFVLSFVHQVKYPALCVLTLALLITGCVTLGALLKRRYWRSLLLALWVSLFHYSI